MFGPAVDRDSKHTWWADTYYSRNRTEIGCIAWTVLSVCFLVVGIVKDYPLWSLGVVLGGPLLLLLLVARVPLGDVPVFFVILASFGGIGWEYAAKDYPPWTVGLVFMVYLFSYEEALSGLTKLRYLHALNGVRFNERLRQRCEDDHMVAKRRIWGYLLATSSSAVVVSGFDSGGHHHLLLMVLLAVTFLMRSELFGAVLSWFTTTRFLGTAISERRRWPHVWLAMANVVAYGVSFHWLLTHGSAFGTDIAAPISTPSDLHGAWFGELETVSTALVLWTVAVFREEWTS